MLKKIFKGALIGAGLLGLTLPAVPSQADVDINIYGASAQYLYWTSAAPGLLTAKGCTGIVSAADSTGVHGVTEGNCGATYGKVTIRYTSKASYDGIYACKGQVPPASAGGQPTCAPNARQRMMASSVATPNTLACQTITIGASDVNGTTFGQITNGQLKGHRLGGNISRTIEAIDPTPATVLCRPVVVPFGFFKNTAALPTLDNITQPMAGVIFGNPLGTMWSDFDDHNGSYPEKLVTACFRHAGSGTHATLVAAVLKKVNGYSVNQDEAEQVAYFNDGSSDMMRCIAENGGQSTDDFGAIGYADADQCGNSGVCAPKGPVTIGGVTFPDFGATLINYQGELPNKSNIANNVYDFWSTQWLFLCPGASTQQQAWATNMCAFASNPVNMPASKAAWWNTANEMRCGKGGDFSPVQPGSSWAQ